MKFIFSAIKGFVLLTLAMFALAFFLPDEVTVSRSTVVSIEPEEVFPYVNSMQSGEAWSPWLARDPDIQMTYEGPVEGVGNTLRWTSDHPDVGSGMQVITESIPSERVVMGLDFGGQGLATATFDLEPIDGGTEVTWSLNTELGYNPVARWMGLMFDGWVGPDFEAGLANLKTLVEGG